MLPFNQTNFITENEFIPSMELNKDYAQQSPSMLILAARCFAVSTPKQHEERALGARLRRGKNPKEMT